MFRDDQIANLRLAQKQMKERNEWDHIRILSLDLWALLDRLEAAEVVCKVCDDHEYNPCPGVTEGIKAWKKASGKEKP